MKPVDNFDLKKFIIEGKISTRKLVKEQLEKIDEKIVSEKTRPYFGDESIIITNIVTQTNYTKDGYDIEVFNYDFYFEKESPISFKKVIKLFKDGNQIARKIFYSDTNSWRGKSVEELIDFLINNKMFHKST